MTSSELKNLIRQKTGISSTNIDKSFGAFQSIISRELLAGNSVNFPNFGNFVMIRYPSKTVKDLRNPSKTYLSLEKNLPRFRPSPELKEVVAGKNQQEDIVLEPTPSGGLIDKTINISYIDLSKAAPPKKILSLLPEHIARHYQVVPVAEKNNQLTIAMIDPEDREAIEFVKKKTGKDLEIKICTQSDLNHVLDQYSALSAELNKIVESAEEDEELKPEVQTERKVQKEEIVETAPAAKIVQSLLKRAVREKASDIHVEPSEEDVGVRFRIDGILRKIISLPKEINPAIVSRVKILSNMKIDETRLPQDGRFQAVVDGSEIDFRISTLPTVNGEKIVMRILDKSGGLITLDQLGVRGTAFKILDDNIHKAHGMILVTGPTGSGKTTTLYAVINKIKNVGINIVTLEDPVEYRMDGVNQSQVHTQIGFTFANGLRSIVRQDPNVIMIGEIRDYETADMAVHAALTGHIVLSTLHTNDAAGAIPRLIDMKIEPFLVNSSINCVIAQRLCRRICDSCKEPLQIKSGEQELAEKELGNLPKNVERPAKIEFSHGKGCDNCSGSGYKGRIGIFEVFELTNDLKEMVAKQASGTMLNEQAIKNGMVTMKQDGILKSIEGLTTLEEVWRVTKD